MKKFIIPLLLLSIIFTGCTSTTNIISQACTEEAKLCPDGSAVGRAGPNCEFTPCPEIVVQSGLTQPIACAMDAKVCPDGSAVGRSGPNCEFATCPGE